MLSREQLERAAAASGFRVDIYEKVTTLLPLLEATMAHPVLGPRMALKGGTAINLFVLDFPRLSVDIDLNYQGAGDRNAMLSERPRIEQSFHQVAGRMGLTVKRVPTDHAGGKWRLSYMSALGRPGTLELDVNFMLRTPLWSTSSKTSHAIGGTRASGIPLVDDHELIAGKLAALVARSACRDLYDTRELLRQPALDSEKLRLGFVVYGGINREDWRAAAIDKIKTTPKAVEEMLPMLRLDRRPSKQNVEGWTQDLIRETRDLMSLVLPLRPHEREFLERLNGSGVIAPELLTSDPNMQAKLRKSPGAPMEGR